VRTHLKWEPPKIDEEKQKSEAGGHAAAAAAAFAANDDDDDDDAPITTQNHKWNKARFFQGLSPEVAPVTPPSNPPGCRGPKVRPHEGKWVKKWPADGQPYYEQVCPACIPSPPLKLSDFSLSCVSRR